MLEQATITGPRPNPRGPHSLSALQARGLTFVRGRQIVLREVDLAVAPGEMVALLGANGAGKTTLLHCLAGSLRPLVGEVLWFGNPAIRTPSARRLVGFVGHECGLYLALTAWENLLFAGRMTGVDRPAARAAELLAAVGLDQCARQHVGCLSRGMRQRLALARAVLHEPPLLLLDEPFTSLDSDSCAWLAEFLGRLRDNGRTVLFTTHDRGQGSRLADRLLRLEAGRVRVFGAGRA